MAERHGKRPRGRCGQVDPGKNRAVGQDLRRSAVVVAAVTVVVAVPMIMIRDDPAVVVVVMMTLNVHRRGHMRGGMGIPRRCGHAHGNGDQHRQDQADSPGREPRHRDCVAYAGAENNAVGGRQSIPRPCSQSDRRVPHERRQPGATLKPAFDSLRYSGKSAFGVWPESRSAAASLGSGQFEVAAGLH